jgi:peptide/nickel transport system ATP-binding protein
MTMTGHERPTGANDQPGPDPVPGPGPDPGPGPEPLLAVEDLRVTFGSGPGLVEAVKGVDLKVGAGRRVAIVGESGSGKSVTVRSLVRLVPGGTIHGSVRFDGAEVADLDRHGLRHLRGGGIAMIFQDPLSSLNPTVRIVDQVAEVERIRGVHRRAAAANALERLAQVGLDPASVARQYPFELSGGMRQRVAIAIALSGSPRLLLADEPTTALDVRVQSQVLDLLTRLSVEEDLAVVLVSHDLAVVAHFAERVSVMYAGRIVEEASAAELFASPRHPYTRGLLQSVPRVDQPRMARLPAMAGEPPGIAADLPGCPFAPRCPLSVDRCSAEQPLLLSGPAGSGRAACHRADEVASPGAAQEMPS